jgi:hypothetical protein
MPTFNTPVVFPYNYQQKLYTEKNINIKVLATYIDVKTNSIFYEVNDGINSYHAPSYSFLNAAENLVYQTNKISNNYMEAESQINKLKSL